VTEMKMDDESIMSYLVVKPPCPCKVILHQDGNAETFSHTGVGNEVSIQCQDLRLLS